MRTPTLAERIVALDVALGDVPHAFGGAIALAYYAEPRATIDVDINVFVPPEAAAHVLGPLRELGAATDDPAVAAHIMEQGQTRVMWDSTPIDLFFAYDSFHAAAAARRHVVPFGDHEIPILAAEHLIVCKVVFGRPKDWVDIDAIVADETPVDVAEVLRWVGRVAGDESPSYGRVAAVLTNRR